MQVERLRIVGFRFHQPARAPALERARQFAQRADLGHRPSGERLVSLLQFGKLHGDDAFVFHHALPHRLVVALPQH